MVQITVVYGDNPQLPAITVSIEAPSASAALTAWEEIEKHFNPGDKKAILLKPNKVG